MQKKSRFLLFCDHLTAQKSDNFKTSISNFGGLVWFGVWSATDLWQPVHGDFAELLKTLVIQQDSSWLDNDEKTLRNSTKEISQQRKDVFSLHIGLEQPISSLFHMKITTSAVKSSHQDLGLCYLHSLFFHYTLFFRWKIKSCYDLCFPH